MRVPFVCYSNGIHSAIGTSVLIRITYSSPPKFCYQTIFKCINSVQWTQKYSQINKHSSHNRHWAIAWELVTISSPFASSFFFLHSFVQNGQMLCRLSDRWIYDKLTSIDPFRCDISKYLRANGVLFTRTTFIYLRRKNTRNAHCFRKLPKNWFGCYWIFDSSPT